MLYNNFTEVRRNLGYVYFEDVKKKKRHLTFVTQNVCLSNWKTYFSKRDTHFLSLHVAVYIETNGFLLFCFYKLEI